jgi:hypothetical protein
MNYLYTKLEHYKRFINENGINRIDKSIKILPVENKMSLFKSSFSLNEEEIFESPLETNYTLKYINEKFIKLLFSSKSNTRYRLDLHIINENDELVNHIAFTIDDTKYDSIPDNVNDYNQYEIDYNQPTNKYEMIEVLNRIHFILLDLVNKDKILNYFCIGGTEIKGKNNIYEYFLKTIVGEGGFKKLKTDVYQDIGWGLYFKI